MGEVQEAVVASKCRSCGAPIRWAISVKGTAQPFDFEPNDRGNMVIEIKRIVRDGHAIVEDHARRYDELFDFGTPKYMPHHAVCPQADKWRRKR